MNKICFILLLALAACNQHKEKDTDWTLPAFSKQNEVNPVLTPDSAQTFICPIRKTAVRWEEKDVFNPAAVVRNDTIFLLYRAEDVVGKYAGTSRIGLAWSIDGAHFTRYPEPVLYPDEDSLKYLEWEGGCEDPRVVQDEQGRYYMTYTAYDGDKARLLVASSADLLHWNKHGHVFAKSGNPKYTAMWSKSGSIVSDYSTGTPVAKKVNGKYWMYWGDVNIWAATSDNLIDWTPVMYGQGESYPDTLRHNAVEIPEIKTVLGPRKGMFDSDIIEPGPPAMLTPEGILLIYNARNIPSIGDTSLAEGTYTGAQVLMDLSHPDKVKKRMDHYFIRPDQPYEISGQVNHVCFLEGLVRHKNRWILYYGTADSKIASAREAE